FFCLPINSPSDLDCFVSTERGEGQIVFVYTMDNGNHRMSSSQNTVQFIKEGNGTKLIFTEQGVYFDGIEAAKGREIGTRDVLDSLGSELDRKD
ncbi:MAG: hypothetical protein C5B49_07470, partial [Bdellovibrio sp.]